MRERMRRRKKPSENLSESTGKIGQAIDPTKPAPLVPSYEPMLGASNRAQAADEDEDERESSFGSPSEGKVEVETQWP